MRNGILKHREQRRRDPTQDAVAPDTAAMMPSQEATAGLDRRTWLACGIALAALNLRLDAWLASGYGLPVSEVHRLLPLWIVPLLSVLLVAWVAALVRTRRAV